MPNWRYRVLESIGLDALKLDDYRIANYLDDCGPCRQFLCREQRPGSSLCFSAFAAPLPVGNCRLMDLDYPVTLALGSTVSRMETSTGEPTNWPVTFRQYYLSFADVFAAKLSVLWDEYGVESCFLCPDSTQVRGNLGKNQKLSITGQVLLFPLRNRA